MWPHGSCRQSNLKLEIKGARWPPPCPQQLCTWKGPSLPWAAPSCPLIHICGDRRLPVPRGHSCPSEAQVCLPILELPGRSSPSIAATGSIQATVGHSTPLSSCSVPGGQGPAVVTRGRGLGQEQTMRTKAGEGPTCGLSWPLCPGGIRWPPLTVPLL